MSLGWDIYLFFMCTFLFPLISFYLDFVSVVEEEFSYSLDISKSIVLSSPTWCREFNRTSGDILNLDIFLLFFFLFQNDFCSSENLLYLTIQGLSQLRDLNCLKTALPPTTPAPPKIAS